MPSRRSARPGVTQDFILAELAAHARILRIVDGPDEVHREAVARREVTNTRRGLGNPA